VYVGAYPRFSDVVILKFCFTTYKAVFAAATKIFFGHGRVLGAIAPPPNLEPGLDTVGTFAYSTVGMKLVALWIIQ